MNSYFARFQRDGDGWLVTFPDVPEAITGGPTKSEALVNAADALEVALLTYVQDHQPLPVAAAQSGEAVSVSATVAVKIAFVQAFRSGGLTRVEVARRLGKQEGEVRRMLDPYHNTKLHSLEAGLRVLGKQLVVSVRDAA
ncbi:MAG: type II toxin-antitoxin system HicB family antitoxin [Devosia sp.]|uniref:type II toxin-antitoxin system HicB family antitoxin n=1 Tax=Devosia sp. TaxID=1871048 RepID=UPI0024C9C964|nr:type II toxin-antitoxin system HicB family antitoxin [Devosia sp.]UYN98323.1 MAG: type II toxin-antitoxin system HicB family antitoxin [Devosia sp.]